MQNVLYAFSFTLWTLHAQDISFVEGGLLVSLVVLLDWRVVDVLVRPHQLLVWQWLDDLRCHHCWYRVCRQLLGKIVSDLTHHMLDQTYVVEWAVEGLVAVDLLPVEVLGPSPYLLDAHGSQVWTSRHVPDGLDGHLLRSNQLLDYLSFVYACVVPHHR